MSTPIYDTLCEAMPGPSGPDGEAAATTAPGTVTDGAADHDGHGTASANGEVGTAHEDGGAADGNGRVASSPTADGTSADR